MSEKSAHSRETSLLGYWPRPITLGTLKMAKTILFQIPKSIFREMGVSRKIVRKKRPQSRNFATRLLATPNNPRATAIPEIAFILNFTTLLHKLAFRKLRQYRSVQNPGLTAPQIVHLNSYLIYSIITSQNINPLACKYYHQPRTSPNKLFQAVPLTCVNRFCREPVLSR